LFARLKNSSDFLIESIESHINLVDEIILVDNNSEDDTKEICLKMQAKYNKKIIFYPYEPQVITY
jgi:glycosyltransferase involved in cell wall biosynthesis